MFPPAQQSDLGTPCACYPALLVWEGNPATIRLPLVEAKQPFFSIVIPTYARPARLASCLQSLSLLDYPRDHFEVIVVDDGSEKPPETVIDDFCDRLDVVLLAQSHQGPATARNTGAARAKGQFLAFTDDDCEPAPEWLQALASRFAATPDCAVGGRTLNALHNNPCSTASQMLVDYLYDYYNRDPHKAVFFTSNNLALPADRFRTIGGFDTTFSYAAGEDREFCDRWLNRGYPMIYVPEALVRHSHFLGCRTFCKQHFNWGRGAFLFHQVRARRAQGHHKFEPVRFYLNLLRYPFSQGQTKRPLLLALLLLVSQGTNAAGFFWGARSKSARRSMKTHKGRDVA
jgi:glycosyltransferase involved in cell wall biosynthesis